MIGKVDFSAKVNESKKKFRNKKRHTTKSKKKITKENTKEITPTETTKDFKLRILSLNVNEYQNNGHDDGTDVHYKIIELIRINHPDIVCLQEGNSEYVNFPEEYMHVVSNREKVLKPKGQDGGGYNITTELLVNRKLNPTVKFIDLEKHMHNQSILCTITLPDNSKLDVANVHLIRGRIEADHWEKKIDPRENELMQILKNKSENPLIIIGNFDSPMKTNNSEKTTNSHAKAKNISNRLLFSDHMFNVDGFVKNTPNIDYVFKVSDDASTSAYGKMIVDYALKTSDLKLNLSELKLIKTNNPDCKYNITDHNGILLELSNEKIKHPLKLSESKLNFSTYFNSFRFEELKNNNPNVKNGERFLFKVYDEMKHENKECTYKQKIDEIDIYGSEIQNLIVNVIDYFFEKKDDAEWMKHFVVYIFDITSIWNPDNFKLKNRLPVQLIKPNDKMLNIIDSWSDKKGIEKLESNFRNDIDVISSNINYLNQKHKGVLDCPIKYCNTTIRLPTCLKENVMYKFILDTVAYELAIRCILEKNGKNNNKGKTLLDKHLTKKTRSRISELYEDILIGLKGLNKTEKELIKGLSEYRLFDDYVLYITVHNSMVNPGEVQRNAGMHVDGFQGTRYPTKFPNDHSYLFVNEGSTLFTDAIFNPPKRLGNYDYAQNWYEGEFGMNTLKKYLKPGQCKNLYMMSGMQIHEAGAIPKECTKPTGRIFYRAEYVMKDYDRNGDSINTKLGNFETYTDRSIATTLKLTDTKKLHGAKFGTGGARGGSMNGSDVMIDPNDREGENHFHV